MAIQFFPTAEAPRLRPGCNPTRLTPQADRLVVAHTQDLALPTKTPNTKSSSTQHALSASEVRWQPIPQSGTSATNTTSAHLIAVWPGSPQTPTKSRQPPALTPLIHIPQCRLEITPISAPNRVHSVKLERIALPGAIIRTLLSRLPLPGATAVPHFDDGDEWVYSRCLLSDFTGFGEEEAAVLSAEGRLCCWASVGAIYEDGTENSGWDLGVMVHRVFSHTNLQTGECSCAC